MHYFSGTAVNWKYSKINVYVLLVRPVCGIHEIWRTKCEQIFDVLKVPFKALLAKPEKRLYQCCITTNENY